MPERDPLSPHPIFRDTKPDQLSDGLAQIDCYICSSSKDRVEFVVDLTSPHVRYTVKRSDILASQSCGSPDEHKARLSLAATTELTEKSELKLEVGDLASLVDAFDAPETGCNCSTEVDTRAAALAPGIGGGFAPLDCQTGCNRAKRRCEGLFPTPAKRRACQRAYNRCRLSCIDKENEFSPGIGLLY